MTPATYHPTHSRTLPPPDQGNEDNLFLVINDLLSLRQVLSGV